ncbi:MAG: magnesium-translocating P-type ATPase, partial [Candidatus Micrarchaeota archaeon]|nr:magnesium-translocating P-type ATPase [Candidatus Micrarchaeota archaeon]
MEPDVWRMELQQLYERLSTSPSGLSSREAKKRLETVGPNAIPDKDSRAWLDILLSQLSSPIIIILIVASLIAGYLGDISDTAIILVTIGATVLLGFFQEYKSEKVLSELKKYFSYHAVVMRDGEKGQVDSTELVPGDIVFVGLGDIVPADLRLLEAGVIIANESVLTGESREVRKDASSLPSSSANPQDIKNGLFMGTTIVDGYAKCLVLSTGQATFFGKTASVFSSRVPESDFQIGIRKFGGLLVRIIFVMTVFVFTSNIALGHGTIADSALFALALAVGIAPEAMPAVITVSLSNGSMRLAQKKVIAKKLAAIEDLGNMDILCTDKTGTLSEEGILMEKYVDLDMRDSHDVFEYALLCNSAVGAVRIRGNPFDVAIKKRGHILKTDLSHFSKLQDIPFDYSRRRMGQVVLQGKERVLVVKGEPESVLSVCSKLKMSSKLFPISQKRAYFRKLITDYAKQGYSTIGVAYKDIEKKKNYSKDDERGLIFIGFVLFSNPPKPTARLTLERLKTLNIKLKILTGDDGLVTKKLCHDIGFAPCDDRIVLGSELKGMSDEQLSCAVEHYDVFARVTPDQKLAIVEALRARGHVVGFMGDGINDAPALRAADVGISVNTAADIAKGASHIILLRKSLMVVCDGVEEGRRIFGNITKYIFNTMSANNGNMVTVALSSLFLPFIPLLPTQILFNNLLSDVPLLAISSDNVDASFTRRPQRWNIKLILRFMLFFGLISTFFDLTLIFVLNYVMLVPVEVFRTAWFLESALSEMLIVFSLRTYLPFFRSMPSRLLLASSVFAILIG